MVVKACLDVEKEGGAVGDFEAVDVEGAALENEEDGGRLDGEVLSNDRCESLVPSFACVEDKE